MFSLIFITVVQNIFPWLNAGMNTTVPLVDSIISNAYTSVRPCLKSFTSCTFI